MDYNDLPITLKQFCEKFEWPSYTAMRSYVLGSKENENGFKPAFLRIGRRVLVKPKTFFELVGKQGSKI